jgi:hypothetical protein
MPISLGFMEPSTFVMTVTGSVTFEECDAAIHEVGLDPRFASGADVFIDARGVIGAPSTPEIRLLALQFKQLGDRLGSVSVVAESTFVYGLARMFAVFGEMLGLKVAAFRRHDEAEQWMAEQSGAAS